MILFFQKAFAMFLAFFQTFFINIGLIKPEQYSTKISPISTSYTDVNTSYKGESNMIYSAEYASSIKNQTKRIYSNSDRSSCNISNRDISLEHKLTGYERYATLSDKNGNVYIADSFKSFFTDCTNKKQYFENSNYDVGRVNDIRLGLYYYDSHIRDFQIKTINNLYGVDKGFHIFGDKLYMEYALLAEKATDSIKSFGSEISIPKNTVSAIEIKDKNGVHNSIDGIDADSVEYVAFDINGTGIVGFIAAYNDMAKSISVVMKNNKYVVTQLANYTEYQGLNSIKEEGGYDLNKIKLGCRIYTDNTHGFDGLRKAYYEEANPLEISVTSTNVDGKALGYNHFRGTYEIQMSFLGFNEAYYTNPNFHSSSSVTIKGANEDRKIYFDATSKVPCLEAAYILDNTDTLAPIDMEVCKNFQEDGGEAFYSVNDWGYSDAICPMVIKASKDTKFTALHVMQNWGKYPIKQISSIEFHVAYYHLSTGVTESNCIAPYFVFDKDGWTLPDFRGCSGTMWASQPQYNSVGVPKFMQYKDSKVKETVRSEFTGSIIDSVGPTYASITDYYTADSGKYNYSVTHQEMPQTDENRTYYKLKVDFTDTVSFENFKKDFDLLYFDGRFFGYKNAIYLDETNKTVVTPTATETTYHTLGSEGAYWGFTLMDRETKEDFGSNFALLIKNSSIKINGQKQNIPFVFREGINENELTYGALTLDKENITFKKGDSIEINMVLLPFGTGRTDGWDSVLTVREDSILKPSTVSVKTGTDISEAFLNVIKCNNDKAEFTVSGGRNNNAIRIDGFTSMKNFVVKEYVGGTWVKYDLASSNGYDGYAVQMNSDGTYSFSFVYDMSSPDTTRTFKVYTLND